MSALSAKRLLGPLAVASLAGVIAYAQASGQRNRFAQAASALSAPDQKALQGAPALAVANAVWALGSQEAVKKMLRFELDRLPESDGQARARVFVRFGIIDSNPDGQAAVFFQACASDQSLCERPQLIAAAQRETAARFVEPGRHLPLYLLSGHPAVP